MGFFFSLFGRGRPLSGVAGSGVFTDLLVTPGQSDLQGPLMVGKAGVSPARLALRAGAGSDSFVVTAMVPPDFSDHVIRYQLETCGDAKLCLYSYLGTSFSPPGPAVILIAAVVGETGKITLGGDLEVSGDTNLDSAFANLVGTAELDVNGGAGTDTLAGGTKIVANTYILADSKILLTPMCATITGNLYYIPGEIAVGVSFTVHSTVGTDAGLFAYLIV